MLDATTWPFDITVSLLFLSLAINIYQSSKNERLTRERDSWKLAVEHWEQETNSS